MIDALAVLECSYAASMAMAEPTTESAQTNDEHELWLQGVKGLRGTPHATAFGIRQWLRVAV